MPSRQPESGVRDARSRGGFNFTSGASGSGIAPPSGKHPASNKPAAPITVASVLKATNHYTVLKLKPSVLNKAKNPKSKVTAAFRKASLRVHPDKNDDLRAAEAFVRVREAYRVLSSPVLRATYDEEQRAQKQLAKLASTSNQQMAKAAFEASMYRDFARRADHEKQAEEQRQKVEAERERERARDVAQSKKEDQALREAEERVRLAQQRVANAKKRKQKSQAQLAAARAKYKGVYGGGAAAGLAASTRARMGW